ncbi:MAG: O-antigen ligase family protein, partial [Bradyrhizobium sp.]|nr:O-antigen ligase family protein [Bradyrhizobium sp.]
AIEALKWVQLCGTIAALVLAPLFFGSVDRVWIAIWAMLLSISTFCGVAEQPGTAQRGVLAGFLAVCAAYAVVAIVQVAPHLIEALDDPIWQRVNSLLGLGALPRISTRAEIPPEALGRFLLLVTSLASGFFAATSRRNSDLLVSFAQSAILLYAIYGILALALTPSLLLWSPKVAYRGFLTATFVNHNTAATLVGAGAILWFCSAGLSLQSLRISSIRLLLLLPSSERVAFELILRSGAGLVCFFALLFTGSRGGLICASLGLLTAIGLMIANRLKTRLWYILGSGAVALVLVVIWLGQTSSIGTRGLFDDGRWSVYGLCIDAIRQRPLLGSGIGTFADIFPSLRSTDLSSWGVWEYAHSTIVEIAVEMGLPIAAIVILAAVVSFLILARAALRSQGRSRSALSAIAGIAVLSYLHSLIDFSLQIPGYLIVFGILLGCGLARASAESAPDKERSPLSANAA